MSATGPDATVVIPTRDRSQMLRRALDSVLAQEGLAVEAIVVDDGSREPVSVPQDDRASLVRHEVSRGVSEARNSGLARARAPWIAFLDDDDFYAPTKLAAQLEAATAGGADVVLCGWAIVDGEGRFHGSLPPPDGAGLARALHEICAVGPPGCVLIRTDLVRQAGGFDPAFAILADWDLWLRTIPGRVVASVTEPLVAYTIHRANMQVADVDRSLPELSALRRKHAGLAAAAGRPVGSDDYRRWVASRYKVAGRRWRGAALQLAVAARSRSAADLKEAYRFAVGEIVARVRGLGPPALPTSAPPWLRR